MVSRKKRKLEECDSIEIKRKECVKKEGVVNCVKYCYEVK